MNKLIVEKRINNTLPAMMEGLEIYNGAVIRQWQYWENANGDINQDTSLVGKPSDKLTGYRKVSDAQRGF